MATKTITIMEDAYERLARAKLPNESFSDVIRRELSPKKDLLKLWGAWDESFADNVKKSIEERRKFNKKERTWRENIFA